MSLRDQRQQEFAHKWIDSGKRGILHLCPRMGKCRTAIIALIEEHFDKVLVAFPDRKIGDAWKNEFTIMDYDTTRVTYTTHLSLKKHVTEWWDVIILDECHLLSSAQVEICKDIQPGVSILALSGTLSSSTENYLYNNLQLPVVAEYPIAQAIEEGVIADYEITIVSVPLDNLIKQNYKSVFLTEKAMFDRYGWIITKLENQGNDTMFPRLARMRIIQHSLAKQRKTVQLLQEFKDERVLVFCGLTDIADNLGILSYHSKSNEKDLFEDFISGKGNHMAVVRIGATGITFTPLNRIIINYFSSSDEDLVQKVMRSLSFEFANPNKIAKIIIITSTEETELKWLRKALSMFQTNKINYI